MPAIPLKYSKSEINRAGKALRGGVVLVDPQPANMVAGMIAVEEDYFVALEIAAHFRAVHAYPLGKATMGLRSMIRTEGCQVEVSQRLKRLPTIIDKLLRNPIMDLARIEDIGGYRAVLHDLDEVRRVWARIQRRGRVCRTRDYIDQPKPSGYRAIHLVVLYDDRRIEIQLRVALALADEDAGKGVDRRTLDKIGTLRAEANPYLA